MFVLDFAGRFLAELTQEVIRDLEERRFQHVEWRVSIYGRDPREWESLASWMIDNKLFSTRVRWLIQVPRSDSRQCSRDRSRQRD